jgi:hypothetical protein
MKKKRVQGIGEVSFGLQITLNDRARSYLAKRKNILLVDAQGGSVDSLLGLSHCKIPFDALHFIVLRSY